MGNRSRKSTVLVSLVLVPLNLLGLGFTGCDSRDDSPNPTATATDAAAADASFEETDDLYNLDPVTSAGLPTTSPSTQPAGHFTPSPSRSSHYYSSSRSGVGFFPVPYRPGYRPVYRSTSSGFRTSSPSVLRSTPSRSSSSSVSHSSGTSRGGFGSSAASHSASS